MTIGDKIDMLLNRMEKFLGNYIKDNLSLIVLAVFIAIFCYGYELFNFSLSIDEELLMFNNNGFDWIRQGRWATFLLRGLIMPESLIPFVPTFVAVSFLVISALLLVSLVEGDSVSKAIFLLVFLTVPSIAYFMEFNTYNFSITIGMASALLGVSYANKFVETNKYYHLIGSIIFLSLSIGVYQAMLTVWLCVFLLLLLSKLLNQRDLSVRLFLKYVVVASLVVITSLVLYKFADYAFLKAYGLSESSYLDNYVGWKDYDRTIDMLSRYYKTHFTGTGFYGEKIILSLWFVIPCLVFVFIKKGGVRLLCAGLLLLAGIVFSPFALSLILGTPLPARSLVALPFMVGGIWYLASLNVGVKVRYFFLLVAVFIAMSNSFTTTRLFYADYLTWQADRDFANRILDRMYDVGIDYDPRNPIPVAFIGEKGYTSNVAFIHGDVFGSSFFQWDRGNIHRIVAFMKTLGVEEFVAAPLDKQAIAIKESKTMKKWPHRESILYKDGMLIIKLGEPTPRQLSLTQKYRVN